MNRELLTKSQLIEQAKKIEDPEERVLFVMHYFLDTVSYDYAFLLGSGYAQGNMSKLTGKRIYYKNPLKRDGDNLPDYLIKYQTDAVRGENGEFLDHSDIINGISTLENDVSKNGGSHEEYVERVKEYLKEQLSQHLDNPELVEQNVDRLMEFLLEINSLIGNSKVAGQDATIGYSLEFALMELILKKERIFNPLQVKDGLITQGVCIDYSKQIVPLLQELGIDAYCIGGTSELNHEWIIAQINGELKSIDLTRAVFIRDGFKGIPKDQTMDEWLFCSLKHSLEMQTTRTISEIGDEKLKTVIDSNNYDEEEFKKLLQEFDEKSRNQSSISLSDIRDSRGNSIEK